MIQSLNKWIMRIAVLFLCGPILPWSMAFASQCFMAKEKGQITYAEGDCDKRYSPCSTFKIALSLIGYDAGILEDEKRPLWKFTKGDSDFLDLWKQDQTPISWMKNSCVWYSQTLTTKLGMEKLKDYIRKFDYGNKDLSGDKGQYNGLKNAWLSSSLEISSAEQIAFLEKLLSNQCPVTRRAHEMTKKILFLEDLPRGWRLYGKTGSGVLLSPDRKEKLELQQGWFIGWIEKGDRVIIFSNHIADDQKEKTFASLRAKVRAKEKLIEMIMEEK